MLRNLGLPIVFLLTLYLSGQTQSFEGSVTYSLKLENADPRQIPDSVFNMMFAGASTSEIRYYKENKYKSVTDGSKKSIQIYEPFQNRLYDYIEGSDFAMWSEWNKQTVIEKLNIKEIILGLECNSLRMQTSNNEMILFYSDKYSIDASKLKTDNPWERYLRIAGAIPLKYIIKGGGAKQMTILTATSVTESKLGEDFFSIPKFKQLMKNPF